VCLLGDLMFHFCMTWLLDQDSWLFILSPETGYPDWGFSWFFSVPILRCWDSTLKLGHDCFFSHPFQFITHLSSFPLMLCSLSYLNKLQMN
jgi:hypothetical protein